MHGMKGLCAFSISGADQIIHTSTGVYFTKMELDIADLAVVREELDTLDKLIAEEATKSRRFQQLAESCEEEETALRRQLPAILGSIGSLECRIDDSNQVLSGFQACCQEQQEKHALCEVRLQPMHRGPSTEQHCQNHNSFSGLLLYTMQLTAEIARADLRASMDNRAQKSYAVAQCVQAAGDKAKQVLVNEVESFVARCDEFTAEYDYKILMDKTGNQLCDVELCRVRIAKLEAAVRDWGQKIAAADQAAHASREELHRIQEECTGSRIRNTAVLTKNGVRNLVFCVPCRRRACCF